MKEEIAKKLIEYVESTKDFVLAQAPDVIQQMLRYKLISSIACFSLLFLIFITCAGVFYFCFMSPERTTYGDLLAWQFIGMMASTLIGIVSFIQACCHADTIIEIKTAPKFFIIKEVKKL